MSVLLPSKPPKEKKPKFQGDPDEFRLTLVEHLEELRGRIIKSLLVVCVGWGIGWVYFQPVYNYFNGVVKAGIRAGAPKNIPPPQEVFHNATDAFLLQLHLSFYIGLLISFPYLILQLWGFVAPALKDNEQKPFKRLAPMSAVLFCMGVGFAWFVTPSALKWFTEYLVNFPGTQLLQEAGTMVFFVLKLLLAFGLGFQLPLIVYGLGLAGLLSADTLLKYWRQSSIAIFVIASIVTPSNDPVTMLAMAIPLVVLFVISVYAVKYVQRDRARIVEEE